MDFAERKHPSENRVPPTDNTSELYLDKLNNTSADRVDIKKAKARQMTSSDKRVITMLAVLNCAVIAFIGIYLSMTGGGEEYQHIAKEAHFEEGRQFFQIAEVFDDETLKANYDSSVQYPSGIVPEFMPLYSENNDTVAWLRIEDTNIDHVILQGSDNDEYNRANFYSEYYLGGSLYMDYRNKISKSLNGLSKNTIIYGHYLNPEKYGGGMFTNLNMYEDIEYYKEHPIIELGTLYGKCHYKIIAAFIAANVAQNDNSLFYYWDNEFSEENTLGFASECARRSFFRTENAIDVLPTDKFLTLSTCSHTCDIDGEVNARFVVVARLVREGESMDIDMDKVYVNENPRMPQLWYDLRGLENPYASVPVWQYD